MDQHRCSVVIRAHDEAARIGRCLELLAVQRGVPAPEVIVVDDRSVDATARIARSAGATVLPGPDGPFSFGGALNHGAAHASGEIVVALSADAHAEDPGWLERLLACFDSERVACASGERYRPDGRRLERRVLQDAAALAAAPEWGYSNGAGGFRRALWAQRPFRSDLPGCEDREWSAHWLAEGYLCVVDPELSIAHDHTHDPLPAIYRRARREAEGFARFRGTPPQSPGALAAEWWGDLRFYDSALRARLSHRRAARLLGTFAGRRAAR